ncbi:hypothetical protein [Synechococcus elongatus]|uniref:Uncharacterized protein n=2 Tax=Synechococcus elongatus TaxID=32046 RepID=A0AAN1QPV7_SYNEL|nr:hypothetical protein [Synechococcus elongatus]QFZ92336.1 hypothetical protein EKO22_08185 [Synechococcus elongatus PCC 11802]
MWSMILLAQAATGSVEPASAADQLQFPIEQPKLEIQADSPPADQQPRYSTLEELLGGVKIELTFGDLARYGASFRVWRW